MKFSQTKNMSRFDFAPMNSDQKKMNCKNMKSYKICITNRFCVNESLWCERTPTDKRHVHAHPSFKTQIVTKHISINQFPKLSELFTAMIYDERPKFVRFTLPFYGANVGNIYT